MHQLGAYQLLSFRKFVSPVLGIKILWHIWLGKVTFMSDPGLVTNEFNTSESHKCFAIEL